MAFTYEYDVNLAAYRLTPVTKRQPVRLAILECIAGAIQKERDVFFNNYLQGSNDPLFDIGDSYIRGDVVNYQNRIHECVNDITGELPTNRDYWVQITADFRGATERIKYNFQTIILTWIVNKWFGTTFNQPITLANSDIYIVNNIRDGDAFVVANESIVDGNYNTSYVSESPVGLGSWIGDVPYYSFGPNFTVYYPISLIPDTMNEKYFQLTSLINQYKVFGSTVNYISY